MQLEELLNEWGGAEGIVKSELSWKSVVVIALLIGAGVACSLLGDKTLGASLVGGALGFLAQGFGYRRDTPAGPPESILPEQSDKIVKKLPPLGTIMFVSVSLLWALMFAK
jgi:hypothetical protein